MPQFGRFSLLLWLLISLGACAAHPEIEQKQTVFQHAYQYEQRHGRDYIRLGTTGGSHTPGKPMAIDHVSLVTVSEEGVDIANLRMSGIFDKTGKVPLNGDEICLEECVKQ